MKKNKKVSIFILPFIALIPFFCVVLIINLIPNKKEILKEEEEKFQEEIFQDILSEPNFVETNIDLQSIFIDSSNTKNNYAIFSDQNVFYSYEPSKCYNDNTERLKLEERINQCKENQKSRCTAELSWKEDCQEGYCEKYYQNLDDILGVSTKEQLPLCKTFSPNNNASLDELNKRYIIRQNLDGNNLKLIDTYDSKDVGVYFNYLTDSNIYYEYINNLESGVKQLNIKNNNIKLIKENSQIINYPISNKQFVYLQKENSISKYDELNNKFIDVTNHAYSNQTFDKYTGDNYSYNNNIVYKNNNTIYEFSDNENILEVFASYKNIYIFYLKNDLVNLLILNKKDNKMVKDEYIEELNNINDIKYLTINSNGLICLVVNNESIYTLNEDNLELNNIYKIKYNDIEEYQIYHNFILYFNNKSLIIYNSINNEEKIINNVIYNYLNIINKKLYLVTNENDELKLSYLEIN